MKYIILIVFFLTTLFSKSYANNNFTADIFRQIISNPALESCSIGNDIRSAEATYQKQDIVGKLPYIRSYSTALDDSHMLSNDIHDGSISVGGWKDNYFNYLNIHDMGPGNVNRFRIQVLLPDEQLQTYYSADINNGSIGTIKRVNSPQPDMYYAVVRNGTSDAYKYFGTVGELSTNHRGKTLYVSANKTNISNSNNVANAEGFEFYVYHAGAIYGFENIYRGGPNKDTAIYKATFIKKPNGQILLLKYSSINGSLQRVVDQYGNFLEIRSWVYDDDTDPVRYSYPATIYSGRFSISSPNDPLNQPITENELNKSQKVSFTYNSSNWNNYDKNNRLEKIYTISSATSTNFGIENYSYHPQVAQNSSQVVEYGTWVGRWAPAYRVPALSSVRDGSGRTLRSFNYNAYDNANWWTSLTTVTGPGGLWKTQRTFNGGTNNEGKSWDKRYTLSFYTGDKKDQDFNAVTLRLYGQDKDRIVNMDIGGFPCITYNKKPVSFIQYDVINDNINFIVDKNNVRTNFGYDNNGRLQTVIEAVGTPIQRTIKYTYDLSVKNYLTPIKIEYPLQTIKNSLNEDGLVTETVVSYPNSSKVQRTSYYYNNNLLYRIDYPDGSSTTYRYEGSLLKSKEDYKNSRFNTIDYSQYNSAGEPAQFLKNNNDGRIFINFDASNRPVVVNDYNLLTNTTRVKKYTYDPSGLVLTETDYDGTLTSYSYNTAGLVQKKTVGSVVDSYGYNANGQMQSIDRIEGTATKRITTNIYDRNGRLYESRTGNDASQMWTRYEYDANGNISKVLHPTASSTVASVTNSYDALNRQSGFTDELGRAYSYSYDALDNVTLQKAPNLFNSTSNYINGKELDVETNTDFSTKKYTYDIISNPLTILHAANRLCNFNGYDLFNNFQSIFCQKVDKTVSNYDVGYDYIYHGSRLGRLDKVESTNKNSFAVPKYWGTNIYYNYDGFDRITAKEQVIGVLQTTSQTPKLKVGYAYTNGDNIQSITYPSGKVISYTYDFTKSSNITGIKINASNLATVSYESGLMKKLNWANGSSTEYKYDAFNRISNILNNVNNQNYASFNYSYYANGLIKNATIAGIGFTYSYDNKGQLTKEVRGGGYTHNFGYDQNGNRTSFTSSGANNPYAFSSASYTYNANTNKFNSIKHGSTALTISHAATGELQLTSLLGNATYDYMGRRLYQAASPESKYAAHTMQYNHKNERVYSGLTGDLARQYIYDEAGHLLGEYTATGGVYVEYVWLGDQPIAALYPNRTVYLFTDSKNTPIIGLDAATKASVWEWYPDAFGVARPSIETVKMNLRFLGQYYDTTTGLHYNLNRYYNPLLGRYMEADPIGLQGGWNPYTYAGNDPVNHVDPDGKHPYLIAIGLVLAYDSIMNGEPPQARGAKLAGKVVDGVGVLTAKEYARREGQQAVKGVTVSKSRFPESAKHIEDAVSAGKPNILTIDRTSAAARRRDSLRGTETKSGLDRDEFPPAMFNEGGRGASVRHINPSDNRGAGACIGGQCRGLPNGTKVRIDVVD